MKRLKQILIAHEFIIITISKHRIASVCNKPKDHHIRVGTEFTTQFTALVIFIIPYNSSLEECNLQINTQQRPNKTMTERIYSNEFLLRLRLIMWLFL